MSKSILPIAIVALASTACAASAQQAAYEVAMTEIYSPLVPASMEFAGQKYEFDRIDLYERMDRELAAISHTHSQTMLQIKRANRYFPQIIPILKQNGVPEDLIYLACAESSLNPVARSSAKAAGLWQFMPATAKEYGLEVNDYVDERYDIEKETAAACRMLKNLYKKYGDWESAFAAYNGGPGRISRELAAQDVDTAMDLLLVEETSRYMFRILAMKLIMENPAAYGFALSPEQFYTPMDYDIVEVSTPVADWPAWAKKYGLTYLQLRDANPWIRDKTLPNKTGKTYRVRIPKKESLYRSSAPRKLYNPAWAR